MSAAADTDPPPLSAAAGFRLARIVPFAVIALISATVVAMAWYKDLSPVALLERRVAIDMFVGEHRIAALGAFAAIYALAVALSLPGGVLLTICGGIVFGGLAGGLAALVGATIGATLIFLVAKSAIGGWLIHRAGRRAEKLAAGFCADAFNYLLFLRLVPLFPFWLVNLVPALCGVRLATFVAATALGIIPGTFAFAFLGASLDSAIKAQDVKPLIVAALAALGVLTLVPMAIKRFKAARTPT
jgi:uncharacterized membrane protein YdjX (TVP38/TMEM64 family)